ncbi:alpha/beta hydrolase [Nannocystis sp. ILAH1]|uniref:alpha/beta fold hydrolase n=1 Tax=Nannocystis sp. ILAH1 TaxID=2996789 RepID=UPI00226DE2C5|nr:alpha/beta hydrolase [Nannocystis sp. ILAH1]MCY0994606.1 alpha/beta hydrolase [Nannocystis sp. ILAH1]
MRVGCGRPEHLWQECRTENNKVEGNGYCATFEVIPAAGHWPWCEAPAALAAHLERFLATLA